jgi:hypothetical protein
MRDHAKVVLRNGEGKYLTGDRGTWAFTSDRKAARVFDYVSDHIEEQLGTLEREFDLVLAAVPVDPRDRYEMCDRCGKPLPSYRMYYDGSRYLCPACRDVKD